MPPDSNVESTLIWYKTGEPLNINYWTEELDRFLERKFDFYLQRTVKPRAFASAYHKQSGSENVDNCEKKDRPDENKFCEFKITADYAPCIKDMRYGFDGKERGGPCIFLKLNKVRVVFVFV